MKTRFILPFLLATLFTIVADAQVNTVAVDSMVRSAVNDNSFEGTILIADQGNIKYHESFGHTDTHQRLAIANDMTYSIASITKMLTAIVILQLAEEGKLELDDPLKELLPGIDVPKANKITVHHLLLHISGLPNEQDDIYAAETEPAAFVAQTLTNKRNTFGAFNYANIDYVLLGMIIEELDDRSWQKSIQERILDKAGMVETGFLKRGNYPDNFVYTYSIDKKGNRIKDPLFHIQNFFAAGSMYATAEDLLKLDQAMYGNNLLSEASKELMYTSYPEYNYSGYSVWTYRYPFAPNKPRVMERRGSILGANAVLLRMLDLNKTIIILSNNNAFNPDSFGDTVGLKEALMIEVAK
jgi:CubicO group peptidase (beta-lactamase class C family)